MLNPFINKMTDKNNNSEGSESETSEDRKEREKKEKNLKHKEKNNEKVIVGERYEMEPSMLLGKGSFGEIYLAKDPQLKTFCVLKLENQKTKHPQLKNEKNVLDLVGDCEGFPRAFDYGTYNEYNFMAIELLGPSLLDMYEFCNFNFSLQTVCLIAIQLITRVSELHVKNYIHRDIKPENFLVGIEDKSNIIYMIDFGLAKKYKENKTMDHIPYRENRQMMGTARYASINNHLGIEQSRRDDLEAIGYVLIFFMKNRLPWQGIEGTSKEEKYKKILEKKLLLPTEILCKDLDIEFSTYLNYVKALRFDERPDYIFLQNLFAGLLSSKYKEPYCFDWLYDQIPEKTKDTENRIFDPNNKKEDDEDDEERKN